MSFWTVGDAGPYKENGNFLMRTSLSPFVFSLIGKAIIEPRDCRVVFVIQKTGCSFHTVRFVFINKVEKLSALGKSYKNCRGRKLCKYAVEFVKSPWGIYAFSPLGGANSLSCRPCRIAIG